MKDLNPLMDLTMYKIFMKLSNTSSGIENNSIQVKTGHCFEFLTHKTMKLLGSTERRITKHKNDVNV